MTVRIEQEQKTGLKMPNGATIRLSCVATVTTAEDCNWMVRFVESD
jgi:hypothetical protein